MAQSPVENYLFKLVICVLTAVAVCFSEMFSSRDVPIDVRG